MLVGKDSVADALLRHFGSLKALSRASFRKLRQFLTRRQAEAVMVGLSVGNLAETEHALLTPLSTAEAIYKANLDMKGLHQEVVRVVLLDSQLRCITKVEISKGTVNASFACPREILRPPITHSSFGFALVHNHPSSEMGIVVLRFSIPGVGCWSLEGQSGWDQMDRRASPAVAGVLRASDC